MTLRKCEYCGHLWKDRVTSRRRAPERCPECRRYLDLVSTTRIRLIIPTAWLTDRIRKTVEELDNLPWGAETETRRNKLIGRLEDLKHIEKTFVAPEEVPLDPEEMMVLNAEPEVVAPISALREKSRGA